MSNRREFLKHTAAAGVIATASMQTGCFAKDKVDAQSSVNARNALPAPAKVKSLVRRDETIRRYARENGDVWHTTWGADDRQYAGFCDGYGSTEPPPEYFFNSRIVAIEGRAENARFQNVPGYPALTHPTPTTPRYFGLGSIAVGESIYQFLSTWNVPISYDLATLRASRLRWVGVKAIHSSDRGSSWRNQDGSTPVKWEDWTVRSKETMLFLEEEQEAFSMLSVLQMGKAYGANRDGYVYVYSPNGNTEGTMNQLVMLRAPRDRLLNRSAYEYFAGPRPNGEARWTSDIGERAVVHTFPTGWVNTLIHPLGWIPSVAYFEPLDVYLMANWATRPAADGLWFGAPSYLGFWVSATPWGPWMQIHEETAWTPGGDAAARCYFPVIAPKWIAPDGRSFWLTWSDFQQQFSDEEYARRSKAIEILPHAAQARAREQLFRTHRPNYCFNVQRVDLAIA